ncbi:hypothetical protein [Psychroserpens damuponensis]|uniref:hypothetical protein n=1 Tax=Psychroserpens damuponensis TaxID=943936 RepID=UPI00058AFF51|nr:hypothetical protein [Psychroserpens damuponensis]
MKPAVISIILALLGIGFVLYLNYELAELFQSELHNNLHNENELNPSIFIIGTLNKVVTVLIGVIAIVFGIKSVNQKNRLGLIGVILSLILMVLTFIPIWHYMVSST